jgi:glycosyltransferase involved in cell wall biosynthesis
MRILMMTNTYAPHVSGVARSVEAFAREYRRRGHQVLVVCPEFEKAPKHEPDVVRVPAIQRFNGSDFSLVLMTPRWLRAAVEAFAPELIHSHHPFFLGATAVRLARVRELPLVFTHHTMYEHYTHYVPGASEAMRRFAMHLSTNYANLSDAAFAPSETVATILRRRGVQVPLHVVPTGVSLEEFSGGSGNGFRAIMGIPDDAFLVGHVGRLAPEKNLGLLTRALARFLLASPMAHAVIVGAGPSSSKVHDDLQRAELEGRVHFAGVLENRFLVSAYKAMDAFAFTSLSETQGLVLVEAMAASVPVVALSGPGVDEVVRDRENGRLLAQAEEADFAAALSEIATLPVEERHAWSCRARQTAEAYSIVRTADTALAAYGALVAQPRVPNVKAHEVWQRTLRLLRSEWDLLAGIADAAVSDGEEDELPPGARIELGMPPPA